MTRQKDNDQDPGVISGKDTAPIIPSGVYFVQMIAGDFQQVRKMMVLK